MPNLNHGGEHGEPEREGENEGAGEGEEEGEGEGEEEGWGGGGGLVRLVLGRAGVRVRSLLKLQRVDPS